MEETEQPSLGIGIKSSRTMKIGMGKRIKAQCMEGPKGNDVISPWSTRFKEASNDIE